MPNLVLAAPLAGWVTPLDEVPDEVFAGRMMGEGVAIDLTGAVLCAPCDGTVLSAASHAVTLRAGNGAELLMHIGLETVALKGKGFQCHVREGDSVKTGDPLIHMDIEFLAGEVKSLISPVVVTNPEAFRISGVQTGRLVDAGAPLMEIAPVAAQAAAPASDAPADATVCHEAVCMLESGLHARPAARITAAVKAAGCTAQLSAHGRSANGASVAALMALGIGKGDTVEISLRGGKCAEALYAIIAALTSEPGQEKPAPVAQPVAAAPLPPVKDGMIPGVTAAPGKAVGNLFWLKKTDFVVPQAGRDSKTEAKALDQALAEARARLGPDTGAGDAGAGIMAAHLALLEDPEILETAQACIADGKSAGFAWRTAVRKASAALSGLDSERLRARQDDFADLEIQVLSRLSDVTPAKADLPDNAIIVAETLYPSQLATLDGSKIAGIVTGGGGPTSHVALMAASMGVPMLAGVGAALTQIPETGECILDAGHRVLQTRPDVAELDKARAEARQQAEAAAAARAAAQQDCVSADGTRIYVFANLGGKPGEAADAVRLGAEGCGLMRSEFLFLDRTTAPDEEEQQARYREAADAFDGRPVILRTFDIGADKPAAYMPQPAEDNPALGVRGVRLALAHPDMLRTQLRAALRVTPAGRIRLMLPMVADAAEISAVRDMLHDLEAELSVPPVSLGIMIETPSAALVAGALAKNVDFFSVGTNDLTQYTLAMDRTNPMLSGRADGLHPAVLKLIKLAVDGAAGKLVGVCGALAADPDATMILTGLGVRELSMPPPAIAGVKARIRTLNISDCRDLADRALCCASAAEVRALAAACKKDDAE